MTESERATIDTIFDKAQERHRSGQPFDADMFRYVQTRFLRRPEAGYYLIRDILSLQESVHALQQVVVHTRKQFTEDQKNPTADNDDEAGTASTTPMGSRPEQGGDAHPNHPAKWDEPDAVPNASLAARYLQQRLNRTRKIQD